MNLLYRSITTCCLIMVISISALPVYGQASLDKFSELVDLARQKANQDFAPSTDLPQGECTIVDYPALTYQDYNRIDLIEPSTNNAFDGSGWWGQQRPRGNANVNRIAIHQFENNQWMELPFDADIFNWNNAKPDLNAEDIPECARYFAGMKIGHQTEDGWPEIANIRGNGYIRLTGFPPQAYGASLRIFGNGIFDDNEQFPEIRELYGQIISENVFNVVLFAESEEFAGASLLEFTVTEEPSDPEYVVDVTSHFFARKEIDEFYGPSPFLLSTMYWNESAHDTDTITVQIGDDKDMSFSLALSEMNSYKTVMGYVDKMNTDDNRFFIEQRDRNPDHYLKPEEPYHLRSSFEIRDFKKLSHDLQLVVFWTETDSEYNDNFVVTLSIIGETIARGEEISLAYRIKPYLNVMSEAHAWELYDMD